MQGSESSKHHHMRFFFFGPVANNLFTNLSQYAFRSVWNDQRQASRLPIPTGYKTFDVQSDSETWEEVMTKPRASRFKRRKSLSSWEGSCNQATAADAIHAAGYPLQIHTVTTPDGYVMQMERIPRPGQYNRSAFFHCCASLSARGNARYGSGVGVAEIVVLSSP